MTDTADAIDRRTVRKQITTALSIRDGAAARSTLVTVVAVTTDAAPERVRDVLDACERDGTVYVVGDGDDPEVKLT